MKSFYSLMMIILHLFLFSCIDDSKNQDDAEIERNENPGLLPDAEVEENGDTCELGEYEIGISCQNVWENYFDNDLCKDFQSTYACDENGEVIEKDTCPKHTIDAEEKACLQDRTDPSLAFCLNATVTDEIITLHVSKENLAPYSSNSIGVDVFDGANAEPIIVQDCSHEYSGKNAIDISLENYMDSFHYDQSGIAKVQVQLHSPCESSEDGAYYLTGTLHLYQCYE